MMANFVASARGDGLNASPDSFPVLLSREHVWIIRQAVVMRFPLRPGVVRPPLCHIATTRSLSTTPRLWDDATKTKTEPPKKNPMSRGKLKALLAASVNPYQKKHGKGFRPSQVS